jgi:hypothetical protein
MKEGKRGCSSNIEFVAINKVSLLKRRPGEFLWREKRIAWKLDLLKE